MSVIRERKELLVNLPTSQNSNEEMDKLTFESECRLTVIDTQWI